MSACSHDCGGRCCFSFTLPYSPEEFADWTLWDMLTPDALEVVPMLVSLGHHTGSPEARGSVGDGPAHWYTCKNFDRVAKKCTVYATRPKMCSDYPYARSCEYCGYDHPLKAPRVGFLAVLMRREKKLEKNC